MIASIKISNSLKIDLKCAFDFNSDFYSRTTGEWIYGIDEESMNELKSLILKVNGNYSLNQLAYAILKNKNLSA